VKKVISIVVTYNGIRWVGKCLESLEASSYPTQILVIDNGSADATVSFIKKNFPFVELIESKSNRGFGQANNVGIRAALERKADYIFLLNQDAWVEAPTIGCLIALQEKTPEYGIISPLHLNGSGDNFDKYFLDYFMQSNVGEYITSFVLSEKEPPAIIKTSFVNAAAWCIAIACVENTGGFDPIFFHYGEDRNYIQRALFRGFKIGIAPQAKIFHDRDQRIMKPVLTPAAMLNNEWIHFLNQVCDIRVKRYPIIIIKRFLRHGISAGINLFFFNKGKLKFNSRMAVKIISRVGEIRKSRKISFSGKPYPHL
jgi:GT2 family glycosyltransferase